MISETETVNKRPVKVILIDFAHALELKRKAKQVFQKQHLRTNKWLIFVGLICMMLGHHIADPVFTSWALNEGIMSTKLAMAFGFLAFCGGWAANWIYRGDATFQEEKHE